MDGRPLRAAIHRALSKHAHVPMVGGYCDRETGSGVPARRRRMRPLLPPLRPRRPPAAALPLTAFRLHNADDMIICSLSMPPGRSRITLQPAPVGEVSIVRAFRLASEHVSSGHSTGGASAASWRRSMTRNRSRNPVMIRLRLQVLVPLSSHPRPPSSYRARV